tara:strand:+ start:129 stop:434 length:306 start_codon:yes stop_codon:yes gene_type:complete
MGKTVQMINLSMKTNSIDQTEQIRLPRGIERNPKRPREHPVIEIETHRNQLQFSCTPKKNRIEVHATPSKGEKNKSFLAIFFLSLSLGVCTFFMIIFLGFF